MQSRWIAAVALALFGSFLLAAPSARALEPQVRDDAGFFSRQAIDQANDIIKQIKQVHGKDVMVEAFVSLPSDMQAQYDPANKDQFFENWLTSRAKELGVNGVYVLICKEPSRVQIGIGKETRQRAFTTSDRDQMRDILLKAFRAKQFDEGLIAALSYAQQAFDRNMKMSSAAPAPAGTGDGAASSPQPAQPRVVSAPPVPSSRSSGLFGLGSCLTVAILGIVLLVVIRFVRRMMTGGGSSPRGPVGGGGGPFGGYGAGPPASGGGFGRGVLGGILGGILGGYAQDRWSHGSGGQAQGAPPPLPPTSGGGIFDEPSSSSLPSDQGQDFSSSGGDFGGDSGGGGGGDSSSGGDF